MTQTTKTKAPEVHKVDGVTVHKSEKSGREYVLSPKQDDMVKLHYMQGHGATPIAFNLGLPQKEVEVIIKLKAEELRSKNQPLPQRLGKSGANNTPPSEVA